MLEIWCPFIVCVKVKMREVTVRLNQESKFDYDDDVDDMKSYDIS